jgi:hypothetical protein
MIEPSPEHVERGASALLPFVRDWNVALNPEDLELMSWVVLRYAATDLEEEQIIHEVAQILSEEPRSADGFTSSAV